MIFHIRVTVAVALGSVPTTGDLLDGTVLAAPWMIRLQGAIPVVAAAVAARQVSTLGDMATAAGAQNKDTVLLHLLQSYTVFVVFYVFHYNEAPLFFFSMTYPLPVQGLLLARYAWRTHWPPWLQEHWQVNTEDAFYVACGLVYLGGGGVLSLLALDVSRRNTGFSPRLPRTPRPP